MFFTGLSFILRLMPHPGRLFIKTGTVLSIAGLISGFSGNALAAECSYKDFTIGYEISAQYGPNSAGEYFYALSPIRCDNSGKVVYDSNIGFDDGYDIGWIHPKNIRDNIAKTWMYNMKPFEAACRLNQIGVHKNYKGSIEGIEMSGFAVVSGKTPHMGVFQSTLHLPVTPEMLSIQNDSIWPGQDNLCTPPPADTEPDTCNLESKDDTAPVNKNPLCPDKGGKQCASNDQGKGGDDGQGSAAIGNPIFLGRSCKAQYEIDYQAGGDSPLMITRTYNSKSPYHHLVSKLRPMGNRWHTNLDVGINPNISKGAVMFYRNTGSVWYYTIPDDANLKGAWVSTPKGGGNGTLYKTATGYMHIDNKGVRELFDQNGKRVSLIWSDGSALHYRYNHNMRAVEISDHLGNSLNIEYNKLGLISKIKNASGTLVSYGYDSDANLSSVTYADGTQRKYQYTSIKVAGKEQPSLLTSIIDENNVTYSSWEYGSNAEAISSQLAGSVNKYTITYETDTDNKPVSAKVINPLGAEIDYTFQKVGGQNLVSSMAHPLRPGIKKTYRYNTMALVEQTQDYNGNITTHSYDTRKAETRRVKASGKSEQQILTGEWHTDWRLPVKVSEPNKITTYTYNGDNDTYCAPRTATVPTQNGTTRPIAVICSITRQATTDNTGNQGTSATVTGTPRTWTFTYNEKGQRLTEDGPRTDISDITTYTYYPTDSAAGKKGNLATITNALGHTTRITDYDANGNPLTIINPNETSHTLTYDSRQRLTSISANGETTYYDYDSVGQLTKATLPDSSSIRYTYDAAHRLTDITDALGNSIHYTLDAMGNVTQQQVMDPQSALTQTWRGAYNAVTELTQSIGAQNQTTQYEYDANGNPTQVTDPLNQRTTYSYDALNRLTQMIDPNQGKTQLAWNGQDQLTTVTDPRALKTTYTLDGLGNQTQLNSPDTGKTTHTYDSAGNLTSKTDAKGQKTTTTYDALNRPLLITYQDGKQHKYTWDQGNNGKGHISKIEEIENGTILVTTQYAYDPLGRASEVTRHIQKKADAIVQTHTQHYRYTNGKLTKKTLPSGRQLTYQYNAAGQIKQITLTDIGDNNGQETLIASDITYHPFGGIKSWTDGIGQTHQRALDQDGRTRRYTLGNTTWQLTYDEASRIIAQMDTQDATKSVSYRYDKQDRLTGAQLPNTSYSYTYDATGNRTSQLMGSVSQTHLIDPNSNRLTATSGNQPKNYTYDLTGNLTSDGQINSTYDPRGRLIQVDTATGPTTYQINALGQRIKKTNNGTDTWYHYDQAGQLIAESDSTGKITREYLWLGNMPIAIVQ